MKVEFCPIPLDLSSTEICVVNFCSSLCATGFTWRTDLDCKASSGDLPGKKKVIWMAAHFFPNLYVPFSMNGVIHVEVTHAMHPPTCIPSRYWLLNFVLATMWTGGSSLCQVRTIQIQPDVDPTDTSQTIVHCRAPF